MTVIDGVRMCGSGEPCDSPAAEGAWLCEQHRTSILRLASGPTHKGRCRNGAWPRSAMRHGYCQSCRVNLKGLR